MEKHESIEEELDHWTKMRNSRRSKQLREQSIESSGKGTTPHQRRGEIRVNQVSQAWKEESLGRLAKAGNRDWEGTYSRITMLMKDMGR